MKTKIVGFCVCMLLMAGIPLSVDAGKLEDPQITDPAGDAFGYIDIDSVWFYEQENSPEFLYVSMKINEPMEFKFQQTFAAFWKFNGIQYSCGLFMGFSFTDWKMFDAGLYDDEIELIDINGAYNFETGVITWEIPKDVIGNPQVGDVLTDTWSNAFRRLGFIGRLGFTRIVLDAIILQVFGNNMWDHAPAEGSYGLEYVLQY